MGKPIIINPRPGSTKLIPRNESLFLLLTQRSTYISEMQEIFDDRKRRKLKEINDNMDRYMYHI